MKIQASGLRGVWGGFLPALLSLSACSGELEPTDDADLALRGCVRRQPALRLDPQSSDPVTHGTTATYTLSLTNRDNPRCSPAQILYSEWGSPDRLQVQLPPGPLLRLIELAPRETVDVEIKVTSLVDSQPGALRFQIAAVNYTGDETAPLGELVRKSTKVQGVYQLVGAPPCQRRPPSFSVTPSVGPAVPLGTPVDYEARFVNNDSGPCEPLSFFYGVPPTQWGVMSPPPPGLSVAVALPSGIAPSVGAFLDVPPGGTAVGAFQVVSSPPLQPGITEFPFYLSLSTLEPLATTTVGYHLAAEASPASSD